LAGVYLTSINFNQFNSTLTNFVSSLPNFAETTADTHRDFLGETLKLLLLIAFSDFGIVKEDAKKG
jgi:hypothetical protein